MKNTIKTVLLLLLLLNQVFCGPLTTETHIDFAATVNADSSKLLTRVIKSVKVKYPLALNPSQVWTQFPDMSMIVSIPFAQAVTIRYNLSIWVPCVGYMITRLMIDGVQNEYYRVTTGYTTDQHHFSMDETWLEAGNHQIRLQYLMNCAVSSLDMNNNNVVANFKVVYFMPPASTS